jgi:outer membrane protein assembly factor BamB
MRFGFILLSAMATLTSLHAAEMWDEKAPLGAATFHPSSDRPIGWRGDGSGHFPGATPPTVWSRPDGDGAKKNILWETKLPCYSWATPVIVGNKVFTRSEPYDLICLEKNTGKLLWIRSHPPTEGLSDEEKKANPAFAPIETLTKQLQGLNDEFVVKGWSKELYKKKHDLQVQINEELKKIDKKYALPPDMYVESWSGYTGTTPCTDGQSIYFISGDGVSACYDLNGNKKWAHYERIPDQNWGEHGCGISPALYKNLFLDATNGHLVAYDKTTGKQVWAAASKGWSGTVGTLVFEMNGNPYAFSYGNFISLKDGKSYFAGQFIDPSPAIDGNMVYCVQSTARAWWYKIDPQSNGDLKVTLTTPANSKGDNNLTFPLADEGKRWDPMANYYSASPLFHDGLLYCVSCWGNLVVIDPAKAAIVYQKKLPFDFKNPQSRKSFGMGMGASISIAGKYIYMIDSAGCVLVMEPGREYKEVAHNNIDETIPEGWEIKHWVGPHHEQFEATPVFDGSRIYFRGEQYIYCVGEK